MSWPAMRSSVMNTVVKRCFAFPCKREDIPSAVATLQRVAKVQNVFYWREREYCLCRLDRQPSNLWHHLKNSQTRLMREAYGVNFFSFLDSMPLRPPKSSSQHRPKVTIVGDVPSPQAMAVRLAEFRSLSAQLLSIEQALRPEEGDLLLRRLYVDNLEEFLARVLPGSRVSIFGSLLSDMWTKGGDLDLQVTCGHAEGRVSKAVRNALDRRKRSELHMLQSLLRIADGNLLSSFPIVRTRVPILRMAHKAGFSIDLSCTDTMQPQKTALLMQAIVQSSICPELRPLLLSLKWILRHFGFVHIGERLSGFKLTMLVLHFLQQKRLLPPLQPLMDSVSRGHGLSSSLKRSLVPESLGRLFRELMICLAELCREEFFFFDLRTGECRRGEPEKGKSVLMCPEPFYPDLDVLNVDRATVQKLGDCCAHLADALCDGQCLQPTELLANRKIKSHVQR